MSNTYTQLYIQFVFSVKGRENLIHESYRNELEKVITGLINQQKCKTIAIYCNPDHLHVFIGMNPMVSPAKLMEQVKSGSSNWINENKIVRGKFSWQKGYGAFTYAHSQVDSVAKYVLNQPNHHKKRSFREEYLLLLQQRDIAYDEEYLFEWYE
ncbi:MAG: IS200/IS605 family transposase [Mangrovibacterium sp.]